MGIPIIRLTLNSLTYAHELGILALQYFQKFSTENTTIRLWTPAGVMFDFLYRKLLVTFEEKKQKIIHFARLESALIRRTKIPHAVTPIYTGF